MAEINSATGHVILDDMTVAATAKIGSAFALNHLQIAVHSAHEAHKIEQDNLSEPFGPWFDSMLRLVPVSVVMSAAALEANVNELIGAILNGSTSIVPSASHKLLLSDLRTIDREIYGETGIRASPFCSRSYRISVLCHGTISLYFVNLETLSCISDLHGAMMTYITTSL
jgi:hypothetical protein